MAKKDGADEVLYVPTEELVQESVGTAKFRPNEGKPRKKKAKRFFEEGALELYGGYEGFLVRTALIRSNDYDEAKAPIIRSPDDVFPLVSHLAYADQEHMVAIGISAAGRLLAIHEAAVGGLGSVQVESRQLLKVAFLCGARAMFMVHNHPGGSSRPSADDLQTTKATINALNCVGIQLLDHIIVARDGNVSLYSMYGREAGFQ